MHPAISKVASARISSSRAAARGQLQMQNPWTFVTTFPSLGDGIVEEIMYEKDIWGDEKGGQFPIGLEDSRQRQGC